MTQERWQQIERLFHAAREQAPEAQAAFLAAACAGDEDLRREVEALLASEADDPEFLEASPDDLAAGWLARQRATSVLGQQIGHYQITSFLGSGGMGEVYLAADARLDRPVALKLLPARLAADAGRVRRFQQEARAASALNHPNIVTVYDVGAADCGHYLLMEWIAGRTLRAVLGERPDLDTVVRLGEQTARALAVAHAAGIVHRDIKPENIMVRDDGLVKVLDFGLARLSASPLTRSAATGASTAPGVRFGTLRYMSPEQAGRGRLLCVAGEPGIGKTTLVEDFFARLTAEGHAFTLARGRGSERLVGTEAYLPWLEALDYLLRGEDGPAVARPMKLLAPTWYLQVASLSSDDPAATQAIAQRTAASQERMKRELSALLQELSRQRPLVLFFDDLHWADVSTVDLLAYITGQCAGWPVLIVAAYRPSDLLLAQHPFLPVKLELQGRGLCHEIGLEFLSAADVARYLALEFPAHQFPAEFVALLHSQTEGSPLFMTDLVVTCAIAG